MQADFKADVVLAGRFKTLAPLNHGTFGMVFRALDLQSGKHVAIKCLTRVLQHGSKSSPIALKIDEKSEELAIHSQLKSHPNIVNLISSFETEHHSYLVLEYCSQGDLYEAIRAGKGPLETEHVREFVHQLINAVDYLHQKNIFHRDIKPENVFLTHDGSIKLGDFGLATTSSWTNEFGVGSDRYMSPEQYDPSSGSGYSPAAADIWAIGICILNVLFGRNPFTTPTIADPLYADFVRDRQSLFDVFPNMSQDTYNVLVHSLAIDPTKRSIVQLREALDAVVSFTTDDEALDDFCTGQDMVGATLGREPLRTPSLTSPRMDSDASFPWAKAIQKQKQQRQLSTIADSEDLFPIKSDHDMASLVSALDSGIGGMSYKSGNNVKVNLSSSLPTASAMEAFLANDAQIFSKSWSDLWEEEEEEKNRSSLDLDDGFDEEETPFSPDLEKKLISRSSTPAIDIIPASRQSSTPRRSASNVKARTFTFGHFAKSAPSKDCLLLKESNSLSDKWTALGNLRRANNTPHKSKCPFSNDSSLSVNKSSDQVSSWRQTPVGPWNLSKDWRSPDQPNYVITQDAITPTKSSKPTTIVIKPRDKAPRINSDGSIFDDIGDLEWVGGWEEEVET